MMSSGGKLKKRYEQSASIALQPIGIVGGHERLKLKIRSENLAPLPLGLRQPPPSSLWTIYKATHSLLETLKSEERV
jgi:hypothetical protein